MFFRTARSLSVICMFCASVSVCAWSDHFRIINNTTEDLQFQFFPGHHSGAHPSTGRVARYIDSDDISLTDGDWWASDGDLLITQSSTQCRYHYHGIANDHELTKLSFISGPQVCQQASLLRNDSEKDCNGEHNCIIFNPAFSWATRALQIQTNMADSLVLSKRQLLGTHNSAVSKHYIKNGIDDWVALNQSLSLTEQLNEGVRSIELDVVYSNKALRICHFHTDKNPDLLCFNNDTVQSALNEVRQWMADHTDQFVMLYLDVNHPLTPSQVHAMDQLLQNTFGKRLYTVADAYQLPLGDESVRYNHPLPMTKISVSDLLGKGKHVLVSAHKNFENSAQVFLNVLDDHGVGHYADDQGDCAKRNRDVFADIGHTRIWRLNGDRSLASAIVKGSDYITVDEIRQFQSCGINMYSVDQLAKNDARIAALIWSWQQYYPLDSNAADSQSYAVINSVTKRFENQTPISAVQQVLCHNSEADSWQLLAWSGQSMANDNIDGIKHLAASICQSAGLKFAVPKTSVQMASVNNGEQQSILVNLFRYQSKWIGDYSH